MPSPGNIPKRKHFYRNLANPKPVNPKPANPLKPVSF